VWKRTFPIPTGCQPPSPEEFIVYDPARGRSKVPPSARPTVWQFRLRAFPWPALPWSPAPANRPSVTTAPGKRVVGLINAATPAFLVFFNVLSVKIPRLSSSFAPANPRPARPRAEGVRFKHKPRGRVLHIPGRQTSADERWRSGKVNTRPPSTFSVNGPAKSGCWIFAIPCPGGRRPRFFHVNRPGGRCPLSNGRPLTRLFGGSTKSNGHLVQKQSQRGPTLAHAVSGPSSTPKAGFFFRVNLRTPTTRFRAAIRHLYLNAPNLGEKFCGSRPNPLSLYRMEAENGATGALP